MCKTNSFATTMINGAHISESKIPPALAVSTFILAGSCGLALGLKKDSPWQWGAPEVFEDDAMWVLRVSWRDESRSQNMTAQKS